MYNFTTPTYSAGSSTSYIIDSSFTVENYTLLKAYGVIKSSGQNTIIPYINPVSNSNSYIAQSIGIYQTGGIKIVAIFNSNPASFSGVPAILVVEYTKTTD